MTRLWRVLLACAVAAGVWLPSLLLLDPATLTPSLPAVLVGVLVGAAAAGWLGAWTARHTDEGIEGAALAGAAVGATAWAFGLAPIVAVLSQAPVLLPAAFAPDAQAVLTAGLAASVRAAALLFVGVPWLFVLGGAVLGALGGRGARVAPSALWGPGAVGIAAAVVTLMVSLGSVVSWRVSMPDLLNATQENAAAGQLVIDGSMSTWIEPLGELSQALVAGGALAMVVMGLRRWPRLGARPALLVLLGPLHAGVVLRACSVTSALPLGRLWWIVPLGSMGGALVGAGVPLSEPPGERRDAVARLLQGAAVFAVVSRGPGLIDVGLVVAQGAISRVVALTRHGAAAAMDPKVVGEIILSMFSLAAISLASSALFLGMLGLMRRLWMRSAAVSSPGSTSA